ncbi:MAG: hypothetical protein K5784_09305 [Clostridiales bacterium]|jgi:hypothetical protein|nr:hypothetical protein [Clostridiales bacterium]
MNVKVYYTSPKGCAAAIAKAIASQAGCQAEALMPAYMPENVRLMFMGCEGTKPDKAVLEFLGSLNSNRVRTAALFVCNPKRDPAPMEQMRTVLEDRGIHVLDISAAYPGKGFLSGKKPGPDDILAAEAFARDCLGAL